MSLNPIPYLQDPAQWLNGCISSVVAAQLATVGLPANTSENTLATWTLPANLLNEPTLQASMAPGGIGGAMSNVVAGTGLRIKAWGATLNNTDTKNLRIYHGTTVLNFALNTSVAAPWIADFILLRTGAATQIAAANVVHGSTLIAPLTASGTDALSAALVAKITGQANVGTLNDITLLGAVVELIT